MTPQEPQTEAGRALLTDLGRDAAAFSSLTSGRFGIRFLVDMMPGRIVAIENEARALPPTDPQEWQCDRYAGDPGASAPRCEKVKGHGGRCLIWPPDPFGDRLSVVQEPTDPQAPAELADGWPMPTVTLVYPPVTHRAQELAQAFREAVSSVHRLRVEAGLLWYEKDPHQTLDEDPDYTCPNAWCQQFWAMVREAEAVAKALPGSVVHAAGDPSADFTADEMFSAFSGVVAEYAKLAYAAGDLAEDATAEDIIEGLQKQWGDAAVRSHNETMDRVYGDLGAILRALRLGDHARPISAHDVIQTQVLPAIRRLRATPEEPEPHVLTDCVCEGEFIWACGPECDCFHHGAAAAEPGAGL